MDDSVFIALYRNLPEPLCWIYPDLETHTVERQPLPEMITDAMCTGRQLALWSLMGYTTGDIVRQLDRAADSNNWRENLTRRKTQWRGKNGIVSGGNALDVMSPKVKPRVQQSCDILHDDELFFRRLGACSYTADFHYTPPFDRDKRHNIPGPILSFKLPIPQDVPPQVRVVFAEMGRVIPDFQAWLDRNPAIKQWKEQASTVQTLTQGSTLVGPHARSAMNTSSLQSVQDENAWLDSEVAPVYVGHNDQYGDWEYPYLGTLGSEAPDIRGNLLSMEPEPPIRLMPEPHPESGANEQLHSLNRSWKRLRSEYDDIGLTHVDRATQTDSDMGF